MTQFQHTLRQLLTGEKTETSRIVKPEQDYTGALPHFIPSVYVRDEWGNYRTIWKTGNDYAIQPARGVHSVGRYRVEAIWRQDVRTLTLGQVEDEGFKKALWGDFWLVWCKMHDPAAFKEICERWDEHYHDFKDITLTGVKNYLLERPAERYQAWRMTIHVLWETVDYEAVRKLGIDIHER